MRNWGMKDKAYLYLKKLLILSAHGEKAASDLSRTIWDTSIRWKSADSAFVDCKARPAHESLRDRGMPPPNNMASSITSGVLRQALGFPEGPADHDALGDSTNIAIQRTTSASPRIKTGECLALQQGLAIGRETGNRIAMGYSRQHRHVHERKGDYPAALTITQPLEKFWLKNDRRGIMPYEQPGSFHPDGSPITPQRLRRERYGTEGTGTAGIAMRYGGAHAPWDYC